jgi:hypothetical protein
MTNRPPSLSKTQRKLREAQFFYKCLVKERRRSVMLGSEAEEFGYYFSAFIQAGRNVVWALHSEEKQKWEVDQTIAVEDMIVRYLAERQDGPHMGRSRSSHRTTMERRDYYLEHENGKEKVTTFAERYLAFLEKAVQDFKNAHGSVAAPS